MRRNIAAIIPGAPWGGHLFPDSQDAQLWIDDKTFICKGNIYIINAYGKVERKDKSEQEARNKVQRMSTVYQARTLQE